MGIYASLGDISFEVVSGWTDFSATRSAHFAEHAVIEGKPKVQWVGDGLELLDLTIRLHAALGDPDYGMGQLRWRLTWHKAMALVLANGFYRGRYVMSELVETLRHTDPWGNTILLEAKMALKEWAGQPAQTTGEAVATNGQVPAGSVRS